MAVVLHTHDQLSLLFGWPQFLNFKYDVSLVLIQMVRLGIKLVMLLQARSLIAAGHLTTGALVSFFLYQKPMSACLTVSRRYAAASASCL